MFVAIALVAAAPNTFAACTWKCIHYIDGDQCENANRPIFNGSSGCTYETICDLIIVDPDGPGPGAPTVLIQCRYPCKLDPCIWV